MGMSMCGYRCDLCKAHGDNIVEQDERDAIAKVWKKYYDVTIEAIEVYCDGCQCKAEDAHRIDEDCPVRLCVIDKGYKTCVECSQWPCETFDLRKGMTKEAWREKAGKAYDQREFDQYLSAFDNVTRIQKFKNP